MNLLDGNGNRLRRFATGRLGVASTSTSVTFLIIVCLAVLMISLSVACNGPTPTETLPLHVRTLTPTPTNTPSPTVTLKLTPTLHPSPTPTVSLSPTHTLLSASVLPPSTPPPSPTPPLTPIRTPFALTPTSAPLHLLRPEAGIVLGAGHVTRVTFEWEGTLQRNQVFHVTVYHVDSALSFESPDLSASTWTAELPSEYVGECRWRVVVVQNQETVVAQSEEWHFLFAPFGDSTGPAPSRTPEPP